MLSSHPYFCVAHGGAPGACPPGHTIASLRKGIELGADMLSVEVRVTSDEELVVWPSQQKVVNDEAIYLASRTLNEWRELTAGSEAPITSLDEVLDLTLRTRCGLIVDLHAAGAEKDLIRKLRAYGIPYDAFLLTSVNALSLATMRSLDTRIPTAHHFKMDHLAKVTPELIKSLTVDAVIWPETVLTPKVTAELKEAGLTVYAGVVNLATEMRRLRNECYVDGIVTDFPDLLLSLYKNSTLAQRAA